MEMEFGSTKATHQNNFLKWKVIRSAAAKCKTRTRRQETRRRHNQGSNCSLGNRFYCIIIVYAIYCITYTYCNYVSV
jgi:hypothetical protein